MARIARIVVPGELRTSLAAYEIAQRHPAKPTQLLSEWHLCISLYAFSFIPCFTSPTSLSLSNRCIQVIKSLHDFIEHLPAISCASGAGRRVGFAFRRGGRAEPSKCLLIAIPNRKFLAHLVKQSPCKELNV